FGDRAHVEALALVAIAAGPQHRDQAMFDMRTKRINRSSESVGGVRVIDIDRRAAGSDRRALEPPSNRLQASESVEDSRGMASGRQSQSSRHECIGRLVRADQREHDPLTLAADVDVEFLTQVARLASDQAHVLTGLAHGVY